VWWLSGKGYEQLNDTKKAVECYQKSLEIDPDFKRAEESLQELIEKK